MLDRSKFKGNSFETLDKEKERAENALPKFGGGDGRAGFHQIKDGKNYRRIAPAHEPTDPAYRAKSTIWLECEVPEIDSDGKETGKVEIKNKSIFIATQHSDLKADPALMYIEAVQRRANDEFTDKDERSKFMQPINGWRDRNGKWNWGIKPDIKFVCYAWDEDGKLGREELWPKWLDEMKRISVSRTPDTGEIIPDIFTDPDEGYPLNIFKTKNEKGKFDYNIDCELPNATTRESWGDFFDRTRVSDEQLVEFMNKESLRELYWDIYTTRDFDMCVDGLKRFDKKHNFHIFDNEEFLEALNDLRNKVKPYVSKSDQVSETKSTPAPTRTVPIPKMKNFLKAYIEENYGSDYSLPELSKEDLRRWYDLADAADELPFDEFTDQDMPDTQPEPEVKSEDNVDKKPLRETPAVSNISPETAAKIAALRAKRDKKN